MAIDSAKLNKLRELYGDDAVDDIHNPRFKQIAEMLIDADGRRKAPFAGMPTLLDAPVREFNPQQPDLSAMDVALFGVPMDLGVTNRPGSRFGPRALRAVERVGPYNEVQDCVPVRDMRVFDLGDVPLQSRYDLGESHQDIRKFAEVVVGAGVVPLAVGGDHSISHPLIQAVAGNQPIGMVHIDAHCDTGGAFEGEKFHHGGPFRNAVLDGVLDPERTIQIGIRGSAEFIWEFSSASGMTVINARDINTLGVDKIVQQAREVVGDGPVYVSFDIDSLDPTYAPGTGTPEVGGLTIREALQLVRGLKGLHVVGGDVVEVAPQYDPTTNTAHHAAQILFEILSLIQFGGAVGRHG